MRFNFQHPMVTLVLGASIHPSRYSYKAIQLLRQHDHEVIAVGRDDGEVHGVSILQTIPKHIVVDTVTLYVNPTHQIMYYNALIALNPRRIIFNPGTENDELMQLALKNDIEVEIACTLVLLNTGQY